MEAIQKIPIEQIDLEDERFSVNFMPDLRSLRSSIEAIGLIQPILLKEKTEGYQIVCGFRRVSALRTLGHSHIESRVLGREEEDLRLFSISLHENLLTRGFNYVEKAIALEKLILRFEIDPAAAIKTYLPLFSLEPNDKILNTYLSLARMEEEVKRYVLKEAVSRSNIRILSTFTSEDRLALIPLISPLKLSENRLREALSLFEEITRRDRCTVAEMVRRPEMEAVLSQEELTPSQKTERVRRVLMAFRYPRMYRMEEEFDKKRKDMNLPSMISLLHPPFFEGKGLRIDFQFRTMKEYQTILSSLSLLPDREEFQEMLEDHYKAKDKP